MITLLLFFTFVLAIFLGIELISKVPHNCIRPHVRINAISGISIVGALVAAGHAGNDFLGSLLGFVAVVCATINVFGGYVVTDRC